MKKFISTIGFVFISISFIQAQTPSDSARIKREVPVRRDSTKNLDRIQDKTSPEYKMDSTIYNREFQKQSKKDSSGVRDDRKPPKPEK